MKKIFETPEVRLFDLSSDDIMDVLSTEYIEYDKPVQGETEGEKTTLPDKF